MPRFCPNCNAEKVDGFGICWNCNYNFILGQQAFTGEATWSITPDQYNAFLTSPSTGNIYFPAETVDDLDSASLLGTYSVVHYNMVIIDIESVDISFYPNPVKDYFYISSKEEIEKVEVYNLLGQKLLESTLRSETGAINTSTLQKSVYLFNVILTNGTTESIKVIKSE